LLRALRISGVSALLGFVGLAAPATGAIEPDPDRSLLDGVEISVAPVPHRLRPDLVARIVLGRAPNGVRIHSIRLSERRPRSWQVDVRGPFVAILRHIGPVTLERGCYGVNDSRGTIWAFATCDCAKASFGST